MLLSISLLLTMNARSHASSSSCNAAADVLECPRSPDLSSLFAAEPSESTAAQPQCPRSPDMSYLFEAGTGNSADPSNHGASSDPSPELSGAETWSDQSDGETGQAGFEARKELRASQQGGYDRTTKSKRRPALEQSRQYYAQIKETGLGLVCDPAECPKNGTCPNTVLRNDLYACHEESYGHEKKSSKKSGTQTELTVKPGPRTKFWRTLIQSFFVYDGAAKPVVTYRVANQTCCGNFAREAYGIPKGTWLVMHARANNGPGVLISDNVRLSRAQVKRQTNAGQRTTSTNEAITWWIQQLERWEPMPNEHTIKHPRLVWRLYYKEVYVPEITLWWDCAPLKSKNGRAPGSWFSARKAAILRLSIAKFGQADAAMCGACADPKPKTLYSLKERPNHSNFAMCKTCGVIDGKRDAALKSRAPRSVHQMLLQEMILHISNVMGERTQIADWSKEALRVPNLAFTLDDKLGSHWQFLPMPKNQRSRKDTNSRWSYRECLQGNSWPGCGNFLSIVPPMLLTGANFGCTAFVCTLYHLVKSMKLAPEVDTVMRQTDRGPDNSAQLTHGVHELIVREGACNVLIWSSLEAGHSHNGQDATFAHTKKIFYPRAGAGPGCCSPFEYAAAIEDGLKGMNGGLEILWQLHNFDWKNLLKDCVSKKFGNYKPERYWIYKHVPSRPGHVATFYKSNISVETTAQEAPLAPHLEAAPGETFRPTDERGCCFMTSYPDVSDHPGFEKWKAGDPQDKARQRNEKKKATKKAKAKSVAPATPLSSEDDDPTSDKEGTVTDGWNRKRVEKDVKKVAEILNYSDSQVEEWDALFEFHERYQTPESLPSMPHDLHMSSGRTYTMKGVPDWHEMWQTLRRFPRPHHTAVVGPLVGVSGGATASDTTSGTAAACTDMPREPLALANRVTGPNNPPNQRKRAKVSHAMQCNVRALPKSCPTVEVGQLCFIALAHCEGELSVGIGRVVTAPTGTVGDDPTTRLVAVEWLTRKGWSNDPDHKNFPWNANPTFEPDLVEEQGPEGGKRKKGIVKVCTSYEEPLAGFLPVGVDMSSTNIDATVPLSADLNSGQFLRLKKACVDRLREFLSVHRPELIETVLGQSERSESEGSEGSDDERDGWDGSCGDNSSCSGSNSRTQDSDDDSDGAWSVDSECL